MLKVSLIAALALAALGCGDKPSDEECEKLLAHVVDIYTPVPSGETLTPQAKKDLALQQAAVEAEIGKTFLEECKAKSGDRVRCALKARNQAELGKCESE